MNQNLPPNEPGADERNPDDRSAPSFARDGESDENPYYRGRPGDREPDLDGDAPVLRSSDVQRLNRKALLFLAGIVALLIIMAIWLVNRAGGDDETVVVVPKDRVVVPELPTTLDQPPPIETIPSDADLQQIPPLPVESDGGSDGYAGSGQNSGNGDGPRQPTLTERRIGGIEGSAGGGSSGGQPGIPGQGGTATAKVTSAQFVNKPDALLVRGTYLRCVLESHIVTDVPGFTSCILTEPVYSINGHTLLLPKGSKIMGQYSDQPDIARVAVIWDRVITPTGIDVSMASPGVDGLGGAGHPGDYNAHWGSKIMSALLISLISDAFSYAAAENGPETTAIINNDTVVQQPFESATARSMERLANQALVKSANRPATVTINQGTIVNVYVAQDVDFSGVLALR